MILGTLLSIQAGEISSGQISDPSIKAEGNKVDLKIDDRGVYGQTFPIAEASLLEVIHQRLQALADSGELVRHQEAIVEHTKRTITHPRPVEGIYKTTVPRAFAHDPSITVPYDLKDDKGQIFHARGTRINPLDTHSLSGALLFVDGEDDRQVAWAIEQVKQADHQPKIILIRGAPLDLSRQLNLPVYFDQDGFLVGRLGIRQSPARVSQKDKHLWIEEVELHPVPPLPESITNKHEGDQP